MYIMKTHFHGILKQFKKTNLSQFIVDEFVIFSLNSLKN